MEKLIFDVKFDCIIALNSQLPSLSFFAKYFNDLPLIGADGGAVKLFDRGIICDYVVGDLDTFKKSGVEEFFTKAEIVYNPDQEINDFEKALIFAQNKAFKNILILGFHCGELEHTLNNWSILKKFQTKLNLCIYDRGRYAIPLFHSISLDTSKGEMISIIPQPRALLRTNKLQWSLNNDVLEIGVREGARNIAMDTKISIEILEGSILLFLNARLPFCYRRVKESGPDEIRTHDL